DFSSFLLSKTTPYAKEWRPRYDRIATSPLLCEGGGENGCRRSFRAPVFRSVAVKPPNTGSKNGSDPAFAFADDGDDGEEAFGPAHCLFHRFGFDQRPSTNQLFRLSCWKVCEV